MYDVALLDLDGVIYSGPAAIDGVPEALADVRARGMRLAFVTNNASRSPAAVARHLGELGVPADPAEVVTSAQAAARKLGELVTPGARVLVVGGPGLDEAVRDAGFEVASSADAEPVAVVQGYGPDVDWWALAEAAVCLGRGVPWVVTNLDAALPSTRGPLPGNGALVAALHHATGRRPTAVAGKPAPSMHAEAVRRSAAHRPLVVGDRLDTDVAAAHRAGCDSLLVLTGITDAERLLAAPAGRRPDYVAADVSGLLETHPRVVLGRLGATCGPWRVTLGWGRLTVSSRAGGGSYPDALRALCAVAWRRRGPLRCTAADEAAGHALARLGLG